MLSKLNQSAVLRNCKEKNLPFVYFNHQEVDEIGWFGLPFVGREPKDWVLVRQIDLCDQDAFERFLVTAKNLDERPESFGFGILSTTAASVSVGVFLAMQDPAPIYEDFLEPGEDPSQPLTLDAGA